MPLNVRPLDTYRQDFPKERAQGDNPSLGCLCGGNEDLGKAWESARATSPLPSCSTRTLTAAPPLGGVQVPQLVTSFEGSSPQLWDCPCCCFGHEWEKKQQLLGLCSEQDG